VQIRVFFAHPATMTTGEIEESASMIQEDMMKVIGGKTINDQEIKVSVIPGRKDHQHFFPQAGSWDKWAKDVVVRQNATTKRRMYDMFVVPGQSCGRATRSIVRFAIEIDRAVFSWDNFDRAFTPVVGTRDVDPLNWGDGTMLILLEEGKSNRETKQLAPESKQLPLFPENT